MRPLYEALSRDKIGQALFWSKSQADEDLRDKVVHKGQRVTRQEAEASYRAVTQLVEHLDHAMSADQRYGAIMEEEEEGC